MPFELWNVGSCLVIHVSHISLHAFIFPATFFSQRMQPGQSKTRAGERTAQQWPHRRLYPTCNNFLQHHQASPAGAPLAVKGCMAMPCTLCRFAPAKQTAVSSSPLVPTGTPFQPGISFNINTVESYINHYCPTYKMRYQNDHVLNQ